MRELDAYRKKIGCLPEGACEAEVQAEKEDILSVALSGGRPAGSAASDQTALFVRVSGKKTGLVYTQNLEQDPSVVLRTAYGNSMYSQAQGPEPMHDPDSAGHRTCEDERAHIDAKELKAKAADLEKAITAEAGTITYSRVELTETVRTMGLINTKGCDLTYSRTNYEVQVVLSQENEMGHYLFDEIQSAPSIDEISAEYFLNRLSKWKKHQLPVVSCKPGNYRVVLDSSVLCNILATAWQMFSAPFYLSRNTHLTGKLGEKLFSEAVTVRDVPVMTGSGYQFPFDCEGSEGIDNELVSKGHFTGLLHTLSSARDMGMLTTGNAGRKTLLSGVVHTQVQAMPKNFLFLPGIHTPDDIISDLDDGLYIHESYDVFHSINIASGSFTIPCKAIMVKGGRLIGVCSGLTMNGNVCSLLKGIEKAADDVRLLPMVILKSYTVAAPSVLVSNMQISG